MNQKRIVYLDVIRVMACCMIVLMHSPHPEAGNLGLVLVPISFITSAGLCLFFMVSGALLLPVKTDTFTFLKRRIGKIIFPTLFWSIVYLVAKYLKYDYSIQDIGRAVISMPFSKQGHGVLWFMYTLTGLYLLSPILSSYLTRSSKNEIRFYLFLWNVTLLYPWFKDFIITDESTQGILYYFTGYVGYFVLGYYLHTYKAKFYPLISLSFIVIPILAFGMYEFLGFERGMTSGRFWYLSFFVAMMCVGFFMLIRHVCCGLTGNMNFVSNIIVTFSNSCFGIYLMHILIMRYIIWKIDFIVYGLGGIGQIIVTWLLTLLISFLLTHLISHLPYAEYIIGYKHKR